MRIRIIKTPPAPLMDGFDVRNMAAGQIHEVERGTADYLVLAGYAVRDGVHSLTDLSRIAPRGPQDDNRRAEDLFREQLRDARARTIGPGLDEEAS
jgi:hypothetical protein